MKVVHTFDSPRQSTHHDEQILVDRCGTNDTWDKRHVGPMIRGTIALTPTFIMEINTGKDVISKLCKVGLCKFSLACCYRIQTRSSISRKLPTCWPRFREKLYVCFMYKNDVLDSARCSETQVVFYETT